MLHTFDSGHFTLDLEQLRDSDEALIDWICRSLLNEALWRLDIQLLYRLAAGILRSHQRC